MYKIHFSNMSSARNHGSEALILSLVSNMSELVDRSKVEMYLHTEDPQFDELAFSGLFEKVYRGYPTLLPIHTRSPAVNRVTYSVMATLERIYKQRRPDTRLSTMSALKRADLIVASGGDVFTGDYNNFQIPAFVFNLNRPVALVAQTIGPFKKADENYFSKIRRVVKFISVRESESYEYIKSTYPDLNPILTADVAFLLPAASREAAIKIVSHVHHFPLDGRKLVGISVSQGVLAYNTSLSGEQYKQEIASFIDDLNQRGYSAVLIPHVQEVSPKNNDIHACMDVFSRLKHPMENVVLLSPLNAVDFKGIIGLCDALVGVRTHPTIASLSQGIPTVSVAYSRKAYGIMHDYYGDRLGKKLTIDVAKLSRDSLNEAFDEAIGAGHQLHRAVEMKRRAALNFSELAKIIPSEVLLPQVPGAMPESW